MSKIFYFIKFFNKEEYARQFMAGQLRLQSLKYFKELEDKGDGRNDKHEGAHGWHQPASLGEIQFGDLRIPASELAGPVIIQYDHLNPINVLCLYAGTPGKFTELSEANLQVFREHIKVPQESLDLGPFAVLIHKPKAFQDRVIDAAKDKGFGLTGKLVDYFDADAFSGLHSQPLFAKQRRFSNQREYRFALDRDVDECDVYTLDVKPLDDVCALVDASRLNEQLSFNLPNS